MPKATTTGLILAAGKGTRMKSDLPKCLHRVCGVPMVKLVADNMIAAGVDEVIIVVGHGGEALISELGKGYKYAWQHEQLGTGHAVQCALAELGDVEGTVVIACGDTPLISTDYFREFLTAHTGVCTLSVAHLADASGYGRVVVEGESATRIVEQKDATAEEKQIRHANAGMYCVEGSALREALKTLKSDNAQGEYYLTDIVSYFSESERPVKAFISDDPAILLGVNDRVQLAEANAILRKQINERHMRAGVTIVDPSNTYIGPEVVIGQDAIIEPNTYLEGATSIGNGSRIGPNCKFSDLEVGDNCYIFLSHGYEAKIGNGCRIGPFANIRPKTVLEDGVRLGNFVEVNRSLLHQGVKVNHLTYIGDSEIGEETNIGAGTITCNYDGYKKSRTTIGKNVFVGSNSTLVAPVTIGDGALTAAGSVITDEIPAGGAGFGRARQVTKDGWAERRRQQHENKSE